VIVVDADVDIFDAADVMWALSTRARWDRGFSAVHGAHTNELDPSSDEHGIVAKVIIDATLPADKRKRYTKVAYPPVDLRKYLA
jgi:2,5-furandicarboxylate decarboxylase 1